MCLAVPGRIVSIETDDYFGLVRGKVDFGGIRKTVSLDYTPDARLGDFVLVHVGFAMSVLDEAEAQNVFRALERLDMLDELKEMTDEVH